MSGHRGAVLLGLILSANAALSQNYGAHCDEWCKTPAADEHTVSVDANTGEVLGSAEFAEGAKIRVLVINKNPFRYEYRVTTRNVPLEVGTSRGFFELVGISFAAPPLPGLTPDLAGPPGGVSHPCTPLELAGLAAYETQLAKVTGLAADLTAEVQEAQKTIDDYNAFFKKTNVDGGLAPQECSKICQDAAALLVRLKKLPKPAEKHRQLGEAISAAATANAALVSSLPAAHDSRQACLNSLQAESKRLTNAKASLDLIKPTVDAFTKAEPSLEAMRKTIEAALSSSQSPFFTVFYPQTSGGAREITVNVHRKDLRVPDAKEASVEAKITTGRSRITVSGGIGFSTIEDVTVIRQRGPDSEDFDDDENTTEIVEKFAEENNSTLRPSVVAMLNANIGESFRFPGTLTPSFFSWSLGIVLTNRTGGSTETEYVTGPSLGFLDNNLVFTIGYHAARVGHLSGGYNVGDVIPADLRDPLPVERDWEGGAMFGVTYRFR